MSTSTTDREAMEVDTNQMKDILNSCNLGHLIPDFRENKVGPNEATVLTDVEYVALGVTAIGDRARIRHQARLMLRGCPAESNVLTNIRRQRERRMGNRASRVNNSKSRDCPTRRLYIGWKHAPDETSPFSLVSLAQGGGRHTIDVEKDTELVPLMAILVKLFFPDGKSETHIPPLHISNLRKFVGNFTGTELPPVLADGSPFTLVKYIMEMKTSPVRMYLYTRVREETEEVYPPNVAPVDTVSPLNIDTPVVVVSDTDELPDILRTNLPEIDLTEEDNDMADHDIPDDTGTPTNVEMRVKNKGRIEAWLQQQRPVSVNFAVTFHNRPILSRSDEISTGETFIQILQRLEGNIDHSSKNILNVCRDDILDGTFRGMSRSSFSPWKKASVQFIDEDGIDDGGLFREFLRLAVAASANLPIFCGDQKKSLELDYKALNKRLYYLTGQLVAYSVIHRGPSPSFFHPLLASMLIDGIDNVKPTVDDVLDTGLKDQIRKIENASIDSHRDAILEAGDLVAMAGCINMTLQQDTESRAELTAALIRFLTVDRVRPAFEQFKEGLQSMGLIGEMRRNKEEWRNVLVSPSTDSLDIEVLDSIFEINWSGEGSNKRRDERRVISYWKDILQDLSDGESGPITQKPLGLKDVLIFATGLDTIPPLGFDPQPSISFLHPSDILEQHMKGMPKANTCAMELHLPIVSCFEELKYNLLAAIEMVTTFTDQ